MNRIARAFEGGKAFIGFVTGGDPSLEASREFILALAAGGADIVEIGVPFSDPVAEGPVIQAANIRALAGGATVDGIFDLVREVRLESQVPLVLLTYLNPVFKRGYERFFSQAGAAGVDGVIIPDLPFEEQGEVRPFAREAGIALISMVAPTSEARVRTIAEGAEGFLYVVSSMGVTGVRGELDTDFAPVMRTVRGVTGTPAAVGFGVSTAGQARRIAKDADGVIVGSAIVKIIEARGNGAAPFLREYARGMKAAVLGEG